MVWNKSDPDTIAEEVLLLKCVSVLCQLGFVDMLMVTSDKKEALQKSQHSMIFTLEPTLKMLQPKKHW